MEDIAPALLEQIRTAFLALLDGDKPAQNTYEAAGNYAQRVGTALAKAVKKHLSSAVLPEGRMYWNIAVRVIRPLLEEDARLSAHAAAAVQKVLNEAAGLGLAVQEAPPDAGRIDGILQGLCAAGTYDDAAQLLSAPVLENFSRAAVDETLRRNVEAHARAGLHPRIVRTAESRCCPWCAGLVGTYDYPDVPQDVYRRHNRCRCTVEYDPATGRRQNVWTKDWTTQQNRDILEQRRKSGIERDEMQRRRIGSQGQEIIDKPTYNKLTRDFLRRGGLIIRGEEAEKHLASSGAFASYLPGLNAAFIRDDATVSDVMEEMFHALQDRQNRFGSIVTEEVHLRREIEAQEYLLDNAKRYKIPDAETALTRKNLEAYREKLKQYLRGREKSNE